MNISNSVRYAARVAAVATVLAGCSNSGSPSSFAPSEMSQPNVTQARPGAQTQAALTQYSLFKLRGLGGKYSAARGVNNRGWITGASTLRGSKSAHAALWRAGRLTDLGTLGGPDSAFLGSVKNTRGELADLSQVQQTDPYLENFCNEPSISTRPVSARGFAGRTAEWRRFQRWAETTASASGVNNRRARSWVRPKPAPRATPAIALTLRLLRRHLAAKRHDTHPGAVLRRQHFLWRKQSTIMVTLSATQAVADPSTTR